MAERITYRSTLRSNDMKILIGQVAARKGLPGITATIGGRRHDEPKGTYVCIQATAIGKEWLSRLTDHPLTQAAILLAKAAEERRIALLEPTYSRDLPSRVSTCIGPIARFLGSPASAGRERRAALLLNAEGYPWTRDSALPSPQVLIEEAAHRLLRQVPVAPGH